MNFCVCSFFYFLLTLSLVRSRSPIAFTPFIIRERVSVFLFFFRITNQLPQIHSSESKKVVQINMQKRQIRWIHYIGCYESIRINQALECCTFPTLIEYIDFFFLLLCSLYLTMWKGQNGRFNVWLLHGIILYNRYANDTAKHTYTHILNSHQQGN